MGGQDEQITKSIDRSNFIPTIIRDYINLFQKKSDKEREREKKIDRKRKRDRER